MWSGFKGRFGRAGWRFLSFVVLSFSFSSTICGIARASDGSGRLRVLTLNIFAGAREMDPDRLRRQIEAVKRLQPDIIALQEVFDERVREAYEAAFQEFSSLYFGKGPKLNTLPHKVVDMVRASCHFANQRFKMAPWVHGASAIFDGDPHGLMLLLNKSKGTVLEETKLIRVFDAQVSSSVATRFFESVKPKAFLWTQYEVGGVRLLIVNAYMSNGVQNVKRLAQLQQVVKEIVAQPITAACPSIFCADTNADAEEPEMVWFHKPEGGGFRDTFIEADRRRAHAKGSARGITWDNKNPLTRGNLSEPDQRIDFISVKDGAFHGLRVVSSKIVFSEQNPPLSDHYGVLAELEIIPSGCEAALVKR